MRLFSAIAAVCILFASAAWSDPGPRVLSSVPSTADNRIITVGHRTKGYFVFSSADSIFSGGVFEVSRKAMVCAPSTMNGAIAKVMVVVSAETTAGSMVVPITSSQTTLTGTAGEDCAALVAGKYWIDITSAPTSGTLALLVSGYDD